MRSRMRWLVVPTAIMAVAALGLPASADHGTRLDASKMEALGHSPHAASFSDPSAERHVSSDLAFWGTLAFQGNYNGWRTIDISDPADPQELAWYNKCNGDQGDLVVWGHLLVRSWNSPAAAGRSCGGEAVPEGWEGIHIFDIRDPLNPVLAGKLELPCGSHTATMAGLDGGNLIIYSNNSSSSGCADGTAVNDNPVGDFMDIISIPLKNPGAASLVHREPLTGPTDTAVRTGCHDVGVILLDVNKAACASADTINVFDIGANSTPGGSLTDPVFLFGITEPGVGDSSTNGRWHSAAFTWDGAVIAAGWEPGGGAQAECEAGDPAVDKSMFFYNATTGAKLGQWTLPNPQGADENCTIHNYNIVRLTSNRYIAVGGHYQAGTWVVDFTNPAAPETVAWSDPPSLGTGAFCSDSVPPGCQLGGAWSSYWYNDYVFESDITKGLNVFSVNDPRLADNLTVELPFLNPQTQMDGPRCKGELATIVGSIVADVLVGTKGDDVVVALSGNDKIRTGRGDDLICAKGGKDKIRAGGGEDRAFGQGGKDKVFGQGGHDVILHGGAGRDIVKGQGGNDKMNGGGGKDRCVGGAGIDTATKCETVVSVP